MTNFSLHEFTSLGDKLLRPGFSHHHEVIDNCHELKACLRAGEFTSLGGYRLAFLTKDGAVLSFKAVRDNYPLVLDSNRHRTDDGWWVVRMFIVDEMDEPVFCDHTGEHLNPEV